MSLDRTAFSKTNIVLLVITMAAVFLGNWFEPFLRTLSYYEIGGLLALVGFAAFIVGTLIKSRQNPKER